VVAAANGSRPPRSRTTTSHSDPHGASVSLFEPLVSRFRRSTTARPLALAVVVGLLSGVGSIGLRWMIQFVQRGFFSWPESVAPGFGLPTAWVTILAPAIGMVVVSWMVRRWAPEAEGHGVPEVQFAIRMRGGRIRPRVAGIKAIASAISIGSGGSLGREGPIVQIGSSLGSTLAQFMGLGVDEVRVLVAAGAAGAIGSTFNAPIAGVLFAMEVILGSFAVRSFGLVVVASVSATAIAQVALGTQPAFRLIEQFTLVSDWEFGLYLILGGICGWVALLYVQAVYGLEEFFERWKTAPWAKALIGGLAVGLIGTFGSNHIFGVGHEGVELALAGELTVGLMLALILLKILATSITLGAGGSGGVFAPAMFIGAMTGGAFGRVAGFLLPGITASSGAYALVGAAAVFGASTHAPFTAIIILFEMTDNYRIVLPLMFAVVLAQVIASRINPDSIYSIKLRRLGGAAVPQAIASTLDFILVADAMTDHIPSVSVDTPVDELADLARRDEHERSWVVLDGEGKLAGMVTLTDIELAVLGSSLEGRKVSEIMTTGLVTCEPGESLREAFRRFSERDVFQIPVIDPETPGEVVGMLRRTEMMWAFKQLSDEHQRLSQRSDALRGALGVGSTYVELPVQPEHRICFKRVRELDVPEHALVALLRRGERIVVPRGFTRIEPGDMLTLITTRDHQDELDAWIAGLPSRHPAERG
jgi:chloride channel protein, CIC family